MFWVCRSKTQSLDIFFETVKRLVDFKKDYWQLFGQQKIQKSHVYEVKEKSRKSSKFENYFEKEIIFDLYTIFLSFKSSKKRKNLSIRFF